MSQGELVQFLPLILIVLAFWFLVIRPARKRQQSMSKLQSSVETGSAVMLGSGIYGTVVGVGDDTLQLEIAAGTTIKVARQAVVRVVEPDNTDTTGTTRQADEAPARSDDAGNVIDER